MVQGVIGRMQRGLWRLMTHMGRRRHTDSRGKAMGNG